METDFAIDAPCLSEAPSVRIGAPGRWAALEGMASTVMIDVWKDTRHLLILSGLLLVVGPQCLAGSCVVHPSVIW